MPKLVSFNWTHLIILQIQCMEMGVKQDSYSMNSLIYEDPIPWHEKLDCLLAQQMTPWYEQKRLLDGFKEENLGLKTPSFTHGKHISPATDYLYVDQSPFMLYLY